MVDRFTGFFVIVLIIEASTQNISPGTASLNPFKNGLPFPNIGNNLAGPGLAKSGLFAPGLAGPGMINPGLGNPGMINPGLVNPGMINPGLAGPNSGYKGGMGGSFAVTSASPINPTGISVLAENLAIEGPLNVGGQLPFLGTIGLEGNLPAGGIGSVNYGCGNGNTGIVNEVPTPGPYSLAEQFASPYSTAGLIASPYNMAGVGNFGYNPSLVGNLNGVKV